ncbi:MAG: hypothetical protein ACRELE_11440 [Gemmatimonadales bacterium]
MTDAVEPVRARSTALPLLVATGVACLAVWIDLHNDEPQAAALVLAVGGLVVGALWPAAAWRWTIILGLSIFVGDPLGVRLGATPPWPEQGINFGSLIALVPAFIGTYAGVGARALIGSIRAL